MNVNSMMRYTLYRLPEDVYFNEEPQVVRWDDKLLQWRLDGFSDHTFNEG